MALPKVLANFTTSLATKISSSATSLTLTRSTDPDGTTLSGQYILTLDEGTNVEEHLLVTLAGAAGTIDTRGLSKVDMTTSVNGNKFAHDRGAEIKITNAVLIRVISEMNGTTRNNTATGSSGLVWRVGDGTDQDVYYYAQNADSNKPFIRYDKTTNKWLISNDGINTYDPQAGGSGVSAGAGIEINAGVVSTKLNSSGLLVENLGSGTDELGIATDTANALAGTSGTPSSSNKFVTNDDTTATATASKVVRYKSNTKIDDAAVALTTAGDLPYSDGTDIQRLAVGTAGQILKVNSGATAPSWVSQKQLLFTTPISIGASTSETNLLSGTINGNTLLTSGILKGYIIFNDVTVINGQNVVFYLKYGATTVATLTLSNGSGATQSYSAKLDFILAASGATNTQKGAIHFEGATEQFAGSTASSTNIVQGNGTAMGTAAEDSTANKTFTISAQMSNTSNSLTAEIGFLEIIN